MTIKVTVRNDETEPGRYIRVSVRDHAKDDTRVHHVETPHLGPGEARAFYVHLLRDLLIEEQPRSVLADSHPAALEGGP